MSIVSRAAYGGTKPVSLYMNMEVVELNNELAMLNSGLRRIQLEGAGLTDWNYLLTRSEGSIIDKTRAKRNEVGRNHRS